jgi:two-component system phosphate regulon sensor histidine kinase PhoR
MVSNFTRDFHARDTPLEMLDPPTEEIRLSQPPTEHARLIESSAWPIVAAGGVGLAAVVVLALWARIDPVTTLTAAGTVVLATAICVAAADRRSEARYQELRAAAREGEPPPLGAVVDALPDPILVISAYDPADLTSRRYIFANGAAGELLRIERGEGLLVNAIRDPAVLAAVDEALFVGRPAECLFDTAGVQPKTLHAYVAPLDPEADGRKLAVLVFRDETETRQVERTRVDFLANASHELRTPLASLIGFIETLRGHARDDPAARERFLAIMQTQAERMSRLIEDLMSLSRIELAEHIAPAERVDVAACVQDVVDASGPLTLRKEVTLKVKLARKGSAEIAGDRDQIIQVVQNLVDNAVKYSPSGRAVDVVLQTGLSPEAASAPFRPGAARLSLLAPDTLASAYVALRVSDRGFGLEREHLPRLTERFYRVEGQKSGGDGSGSGLGLAIVKHIVNRHRGGFIVESAPGVGTTFTVYLPMSPTAAGRKPHVAKLS